MISFSGFHPFVLLIYYLFIIMISMFTFNPALLIISVTGALFLGFLYMPLKEFIKKMLLYFLVVLIISVTNPFFSHNGVTVLFFFNNKPVTLEAIYYGAAIGVMLIAVLSWFKAYSLTMTSDKFLYLFGKISPRISLVISMVFRFIPAFQKQAQDVKNTRKLLGAYGDEGFFEKIKAAITVFSVMITWALESSIETASSMKSRGYGVGKRSYFSIFRFTGSDAVLLVFIAILSATVLAGLASNDLEFAYYPFITGVKTANFALPAYISFGILAFIPVVLEIKEKIKWKYYLSAI